MIDRELIRRAAAEHGWRETKATNGGIMLTFALPGEPGTKWPKVEIWPSTGTVATMIDHPKKGRTKLYRKGLSQKQIVKIFQDPRLHTGKGYYTKKEKRA